MLPALGDPSSQSGNGTVGFIGCWRRSRGRWMVVRSGPGGRGWSSKHRRGHRHQWQMKGTITGTDSGSNTVPTLSNLNGIEGSSLLAVEGGGAPAECRRYIQPTGMVSQHWHYEAEVGPGAAILSRCPSRGRGPGPGWGSSQAGATVCLRRSLTGSYVLSTSVWKVQSRE